MLLINKATKRSFWIYIDSFKISSKIKCVSRVCITCEVITRKLWTFTNDIWSKIGEFFLLIFIRINLFSIEIFIRYFNLSEFLALNVYVALCYYKLDYYDISQEVLDVYLKKNPESATAINLQACNQYRLYNAKAAEVNRNNFDSNLFSYWKLCSSRMI